MDRSINGQPANTPEEKKNAVEAAGGTFNQHISGDYVHGNPAPSTAVNIPGQTTEKLNYVENLGGNYIDQDGRIHKTIKTPGWFS